jgi:hypothetical protein
MTEEAENPATKPGGIGRRDVLRLGGLTIAVGALVAACGEGRNGSSAPGRVGQATPITDPPTYVVDDAVLLRTAASLENTTDQVYGAILDLGKLEGANKSVVEQLQTLHQTTATTMNDLVVEAGGEAWTCSNPWIDERVIKPLEEVISKSDDVARDIYNTTVAFENILAATYQQLAVALTKPAQRVASATAAAQASRNSAQIVVVFAGSKYYINPTLLGQDVKPNDAGFLPNYAIPFRFGSVEQVSLTVGPKLVNGRQTFVLSTPAPNSFIYNELALTC